MASQMAALPEWSSSANFDEEISDEDDTPHQTPAQALPDSAAYPKYDDGIQSLASVVAFRIRGKHPELTGEPNSNTNHMELPSWLHSLAKSDTTHPSLELLEQVKDMDKIFIIQHGIKHVDKKPKVMQRFYDQVVLMHPLVKR